MAGTSLSSAKLEWPHPLQTRHCRTTRNRPVKVESVHFLSGRVATIAHWLTVARSAAAHPRSSRPGRSPVLLPSRNAGTALTIALSMPRATCVGASKFAAHANVACAAWPARAADNEGAADQAVVVAAHGFGLGTVKWIFYAPVGAARGRVV